MHTSLKKISRSLVIAAAVFSLNTQAHADLAVSNAPNADELPIYGPAPEDLVKSVELAKARAFVRNFIHRDTDAASFLRIREIKFPVPFEQPLIDCGLQGVARWMRVEMPYYEDRRRQIIVVPVVLELLMVMTDGYGQGWGNHGVENKAKFACTWEYQRYNPANKLFESLPDFRTHSYNEFFRNWGESREEVLNAYQQKMKVEPPLSVVIDKKSRLVRYFIRLKSKKNEFVRIAPQVPRHWFVEDAMEKFELYIRNYSKSLKQGVSLRNSSAQGAELQADLESQKNLFEYRQWQLEKLRKIFQEEELNLPDKQAR